ncbi:MAG: glycoside hydrolase family 2 TIM barrel-domain containing protein [Clostridiaceae bacterium]
MREEISLNFQWEFYRDVENEAIDNNHPLKYEKQLVDLPHTNVMLPFNNFNEEIYQFKSLYRKSFFLPKESEGRSITLSFQGAANIAIIYVNKKESFKNLNPYLPFEKEISGELNFGEENIIEVLLDSREIDEIPPFGGAVDYLVYGGIYREVFLTVHDKNHIKNVFAHSANVLQEELTLTIETCLNSIFEGSLVYKLFKGKDTQKEEEPVFSNIRKIQGKMNKDSMKLKNVLLWELESPNLYTLEVILVDNKGNVVDNKIESIGFREVLFTENGFFLNGKAIKLRGLNRHQSFPYVGYAMPCSMQKLDASILKNKLALNLVRTSHYPQSKHFLDQCDEIGLLVFEEIPGWQYIGNESFKERCKDNLKKMIIRDRNHPSIILWGVRINESKDDHDFYKEMNKIAHNFDETRQTGGVRNFPKSELLEDVYTYNDFVHHGKNEGLKDPTEVLSHRAPYLITEHNGHMFPTKSYDPENIRVSQALRHTKVLDTMMKDKRISGCIGWCMADYNTHKDFGSGDRVCYHGVLDMFRQRKLSSYVYTSQREDETVLEISSTMNIGDYPGSDLGKVFAFTNCDEVVLYKNEEYVKSFKPKAGKGLKHPPIVIDDFIGELLVKNEGFSKNDSERIKKVIKSAAKYGLNLPLVDKGRMGMILYKYKLSLDHAVDLFGRYYASWGKDQVTYTFKGIRNGKIVKEVKKGPTNEKKLELEFSKTVLEVSDTYDVISVGIREINEYGDPLVYTTRTIALETSGDIDILGPKIFSLSGGQSTFYIRSTSFEGQGSLKVITEDLGSFTYDIRVKDLEKKRI